MSSAASVYVVLLNWNGWGDTIACLDSLFASRGVNLRVVVCDNASSDGSLEKIATWGDGLCDVPPTGSPRLARLIGHTRRPVSCLTLDRDAAERGEAPGEARLVLVDNGANLGFAAGNNVGLRFALAQADMDYVWVLNNDTLVEPDCLLQMLQRLERMPANAVCGSMIHFFDQPEIIQAIGGNRFNRRTGCADCSEGRFTHETQDLNVEKIEAGLDYLSGCSMLLPRQFLVSVGLMSEDYFLYYEEIDWFTRAAGRYELCVAEDARLYHREGAAIGSPICSGLRPRFPTFICSAVG